MFDFDNFYTEVMCWTCFRFHKWQLPELLKLLKLDVSGDVDGLWRSRAKKTGVVQYTFQPLELLCMFLGRLASGETSWEKLPLIFGGRSRSSIRAAFYLALDHIHTLFSHTVSDISRYAYEADEWAATIHAAGAHACMHVLEYTNI